MTHARRSVGWTKSDGRAGPDGETLHVGLSCPPAVHPNRLWWWTYKVQEKENGDGIEEEGDGWGHARVWHHEYLTDQVRLYRRRQHVKIRLIM